MNREFICMPSYPVVNTKCGKLRGFQANDIFHFYGIKYANARRFMMPEETEPWEGIKDALSYGHVAPLMMQDSPDGDIMGPHRFWPQSEDCQYLNIWTPAIDGNAAKPVLVWIHGGGYMAGSSLEMVAYDGENLSAFGDMVVVSLNHRLNILGYMDLSAFGEKYWNTANLGQADLVAALSWIRENIAAFGGDPDNVTLFGQSGGGGKINALLQTPAAEPLFTRAIIESGLWRDNEFPHSTRETSRLVVEAMLKELQLDRVEELETIPYEDLTSAFFAVSPKFNAQGLETGFAPLKNDWYKGNPLEVGFTDGARKKAVMAGTTFAEFSFFPVQDKEKLTQEERLELVKEHFGEYTDQILELFRKTYPDKNIVDVIALDAFLRDPAIAWFDTKGSGEGADNYAFVFAPDFNFDGGRPAWHCAEIPFAFHNVDKVPVANIPGIAQRLEEEVAGAWINFARCGDPNHDKLAPWRPYKCNDEVTMVFCESSRAWKDFDRELIQLIRKAAPPVMPGKTT